MQISLKWIHELVTLEKINLQELIEKLTFGGFEVEDILEIEIDQQKEITLDISATANRSDSLSIQGISTEMAALLNQSVNVSKYSLYSPNFKPPIWNQAELFSDEEDCNLFCSVILQNLTDVRAPKWMKQKLRSGGILPFNNLLDFQNYILLETGYPFAFYDFDKIQSKVQNSKFQLSIGRAKKNQEFLAINDQKYSLDESIRLVEANEIPISIAGIIESQEFSYSNTTTSLLIEGSIFNAAKIRQQSRNLGIRTDRSTRYEKSLKNTDLMEALYRLIFLLRINNPNLTCHFQTLRKTAEETPKPIVLRYERIGEILGPIQKLPSGDLTYLSCSMVENYLKRLNFNFHYEESQTMWTVQIPDVRTEDLTREIDLIEEIGRLHGFNNFLITLPKLQRIGSQDMSYQTRQKVTSCLLNLGLNEWIHYSLVPEKTYLTNPIQIINPLVFDYSSLRLSLLPNLIQTIQENGKQGNSMINGFEYGHIFLPDLIHQFQEREQVAGILGGFPIKSTWSESEKGVTWFEAKGKLEQFFHQLNLSVEWKRSSSYSSQRESILHPYRTAELFLTNRLKLGIFGQIDPLLANQLNLSSDFYLFELDLEVIQNQIQINPLPIYQEYSFYPKIIKDISFILSQEIPYQELEKILYSNGTKFLSEIRLLDEYRGNSIPENSISLCLQFIFQSKERTLQTKEIEEIVHHLKMLLIQEFHAQIRN